MTQSINPADQIKCPHCGQTYAVQPEQWAQYAGRTINCTRCGQAFTVAGQQRAQQVMPMPGYGPAPAYPPSMPQYSPAQSHNVGYAGQPYSIQPARTSGWAIWSLVCGLLSFCLPVLGNIPAIIFGIVGIVKTGMPNVRGRGLAIAGLILGVIAFPVSLAFLFVILRSAPALSNAREAANRVKCASNMRQLGAAMLTYANDNGGQFPARLEDLLKSDPTLPNSAFVCPNDAKTPPAAGSAQAAAQEIASGKHCSYIYVGDGASTSASPANTVLLFEPLSLHKKRHLAGMNVLFSDGRVEFIDAASAQGIVDQQAAGTRPVKYSAGPSRSGASFGTPEQLCPHHPSITPAPALAESGRTTSLFGSFLRSSRSC
jgi:predicted Zn finger-like uncharacterized protein/prepilin-type processing-associated H-X9-DG protein